MGSRTVGLGTVRLGNVGLGLGIGMEGLLGGGLRGYSEGSKEKWRNYSEA